MTSEADTIEESLRDPSEDVPVEKLLAERGLLAGAVDDFDLELASLAELRPVFFEAAVDRADFFERDDADFKLTFLAELVPRAELLRVRRALVLLFSLILPPTWIVIELKLSIRSITT
jgi:hypothetical protein